MGFSAIISADEMEASNALLESAGFGPGNFSVPLWIPDVVQINSYGLNASGEAPDFRSAVEAIPNVSIREAAPGVVEFDDHVASLGLTRENPAQIDQELPEEQLT